jgi:hypothetical protein
MYKTPDGKIIFQPYEPPQRTSSQKIVLATAAIALSLFCSAIGVSVIIFIAMKGV